MITQAEMMQNTVTRIFEKHYNKSQDRMFNFIVNKAVSSNVLQDVQINVDHKHFVEFVDGSKLVVSDMCGIGYTEVITF